MSATSLIGILERLLLLHRSLVKLSENKTEIVKKGDVDSLSAIMKDENKHIMAINNLEEERKLHVAKIMSGHSFSGEEPTLSDCITVVEGSEKDKLIQLQHDLLTEVYKLNELNHLNQQLVYQSLQFINLSIDMIRPQGQEMNYGNNKQNQKNSSKAQTYFDSKA